MRFASLGAGVDYLWTFWLATRSRINWKTYTSYYIVGIILEYPKTLFKFKVYAGALNVALDETDSGGSSFLQKLLVEADFSTLELLSFCLFVGASDLYINYIHMKAINSCCCGKGCSPRVSCSKRYSVTNPERASDDVLMF